MQNALVIYMYNTRTIVNLHESNMRVVYLVFSVKWNRATGSERLKCTHTSTAISKHKKQVTLLTYLLGTQNYFIIQ